MQWLRRSFIAGFFVTVPLFISVAAILWLFRVVDGFVGAVLPQVLSGPSRCPGWASRRRRWPSCWSGAIATNVVGKRLLQRAEWLLLHVPLFRSVYAPVKQLVVAFSPGQRARLQARRADRGRVAGLDARVPDARSSRSTGARGPRPLIAVYVPTNHLYLGDIVICPRDHASYPDITVEQGIRIFLTGGMALAERIRARRGDDRVGDFR